MYIHIYIYILKTYSNYEPPTPFRAQMLLHQGFFGLLVANGVDTGALGLVLGLGLLDVGSGFGV